MYHLRLVLRNRMATVNVEVMNEADQQYQLRAQVIALTLI